MKVHRSNFTRNKEVCTETFHSKFLQIWSFDQKNPNYFREGAELFHSFTANRTHSLCIACQLVVLGHYGTSVLWDFVIYREDWLSIKFGENDSFRKLFLFFENTFQYLGGSSQDISVSHFDSRRSLSSANRRQIVGDLPDRFFLAALLSLVISMTGRSERSARALRDGADVVREAIGN